MADRGTWFALPLLGVFCLAGCGGEPRETLVPVSGTLEIDGKPAEGVRIMFIPTDNKQGRGGYAMTASNGGFTVTHTLQNQPGLAAGEYAVSYSKFTMPDGSPLPPPKDGKPPENAVAAKESLPPHLTNPDPAQNNKVTIPKEGTSKLELKISTKGGGKPNP
jgi:hypothetical protein